MTKTQFIRCFRNWAATIVAVSTSIAALAQPAYCWDKFGHEVIAQIAYDHMTPDARASADRLIAKLADDPAVIPLAAEYKPYNFVTAAAWQDDARSITRMWAAWHFIDLPDDPRLTADEVKAFRDRSTSNVYLALTTYCIPTLENSAAPAAERARALGMFLHFAGDIHQPLHAIGIERGGNEIPIAPLPNANPRYGGVKNLHAFWDGAYRYTVANGRITLAVPNEDEPRIAKPGDAAVADVAHMIEAGYMPASVASVSDLDPADWALESNKAATGFAIPDAAATLSNDYVQKAHDIACRRLALAGMRMAAILNLTLGAPNSASSPAAAAIDTPIARLRSRREN